MVETGKVAQVSEMSVFLTGIFTVVGVGLLYLYIAISDAPNDIKVLWASGLSLGLAFIFLIVWTMARDMFRPRERGPQGKISP